MLELHANRRHVGCVHVELHMILRDTLLSRLLMIFEILVPALH